MLQILAASTFLLSTILVQDRVDLEIGGPRKVKATIVETEDAYRVEVTFIPVRSFDPGMNKRLSHEKARLYANEAILRFLEVDHVSIRMAEVLCSEIIDGRFFLKVSFPKKGVSVDEPKEMPTTRKVKKKERSPIKAKTEFEGSLEIIADANLSDIPSFKKNLDDFYMQVSDAEEAALARFQSLTNEIKSDRWLLSVEREELLEKVIAEEARYLQLLKKSVKKAEKANLDEDK
jgi:hypothetical protein